MKEITFKTSSNFKITNGDSSMKNNLRWLFFLILSCSPSLLSAQNVDYSFFEEKKFADHPVVFFRENFLGIPVYYVSGERVQASQVEEYMQIIPGDARDFRLAHAKVISGSVLSITGIGMVTGALAYVQTNQSNLNNQIVLNWFILNTAGGLLGTIGHQMGYHGKRKVSNLVGKYNYLVSQETLDKPYLQMDYRYNHLGQKIDIYSGPDLLDKRRLNLLMEQYPEFGRELSRAKRKENLLYALDAVGLAARIAGFIYILSPQVQSSTTSSLIVPLTGINLGLAIASPMIRRGARNSTMRALFNYNFTYNQLD
jgi:hypothetical protein